jgi:hypothetical protein
MIEAVYLEMSWSQKRLIGIAFRGHIHIHVATNNVE